MKLFQRYTRRSLLLTLSVLIGGIALLFTGYRYLLVLQVDKALKLEQEEILAHIKQYNEPPRPVAVSDLAIAYTLLSANRDFGFSSVEIGEEDFRELSFRATFGGKAYRFVVRLPLEQTEVLLTLIGGITLAMLLAITLGIYALNRRLVQQLIAPFYHTIATLKKYSALQKQALQLPSTPTEEFTLLNHTLNEMTARMQQDVEAVRRFTAQAAHEMQTPLAAMRNQLEALQQHPDLSEPAAAGTLALEHSVERLSRLFRSLLLLTRIEGGQFEEAEEVDIAMLLKEKLSEAEDLIVTKVLVLTIEMENLPVYCNRYMADVLLQNLLFNAIRYASPAGKISLLIAGRSLQISNASALEAIPAHNLFQPFYRNPASGQSGTGLGLSIVAQIAARYSWKTNYRFSDGVHLFTIFF